jgi:hypothetical protein
MIQYKPCQRCGADIQLTQWDSQGGVCVPRCSVRNDTPCEAKRASAQQVQPKGDQVSGTQNTVENPERNPEASASSEPMDNPGKPRKKPRELAQSHCDRCKADFRDRARRALWPIADDRWSCQECLRPAEIAGFMRKHVPHDPEARCYRRYSPAECVDGWRQICYSKGGAARTKPAGIDRPGQSMMPNVPFLMWVHVEMFLATTKASKQDLLDGDDLEAVSAFSDWYREHPFRLVPPAELDDPGRRELPELQPITVTQACKQLNIPHERVRKAFQREKEAIEKGKPAPPVPMTWKERGSPRMTTLFEFQKWIKGENAQNPESQSRH